MKKNVDILFSKEVCKGRFDIEYDFKKSLEDVKASCEENSGKVRNYAYVDDALELFVEGLKEKGIKFPITLVSFEDDFDDKKAYIMDFITSDDISVRIVLSMLSYYWRVTPDQIIIERKKGRILITDGFKGYFKREDRLMEKILSFQSMEMNSEENYPESMLSIIPEKVRFQLDDSNFFEVSNYKKHSVGEYLKFVNNTNFKEIKTASQLNRRISMLLKNNMEEVLLLRDTNGKHEWKIERFAFETFGDYLFKSFSGVNDLTNYWCGFGSFLYVKTFEDDITLYIRCNKDDLSIYLYQNGDWVISLNADATKDYTEYGKTQINYSNLQNFYDEKLEITIAKAKKILKENLGSAVSKIRSEILNSFTQEDIESYKLLLYRLNWLIHPQNE